VTLVRQNGSLVICCGQKCLDIRGGHVLFFQILNSLCGPSLSKVGTDIYLRNVTLISVWLENSMEVEALVVICSFLFIDICHKDKKNKTLHMP